MTALTPDDLARLFTRSDGSFLCARWGRSWAPVIFGVEEATLATIKGALEAVAQLAGIGLSETDPELGANLMIFFFRDWEELLAVPDLGRLLPDLPDLVARLSAEGATQYRIFRFDPAGAIRACFAFVRMDQAMAAEPAETLALGQALMASLLWSDLAFRDQSPLALLPDGRAVLRPEIALVLRAAYDPVLPAAAQDPSHALRLFARAAAR